MIEFMFVYNNQYESMCELKERYFIYQLLNTATIELNRQLKWLGTDWVIKVQFLERGLFCFFVFFFSSPLTFMVLGIHVRKSNQSVSKTSMRRWSVVNSHADQCHFFCVLYARWLRAQEKGSSWQTAQILSREWIEFSSCISPHWRDGELYIKETCTVMAM